MLDCLMDLRKGFTELDKDWFVYILECADGTLYTGITNDLERRIAVHNGGKGAKYTRGRGPVILRYFEILKGRSRATVRESEIKTMCKKDKLLLVRSM